MRALIIALALTLPACAPDPDGFKVASALRVPFEVAARSWCDLGAPCVYQTPEGPSSAALVASYGPGEEDRLGYAVPQPDGAYEITVLAGLSPGLELAVLTHELGHYFGCDDSDDPSDLMYRYASEIITVPNAHDLACAK